MFNSGFAYLVTICQNSGFSYCKNCSQLPEEESLFIVYSDFATSLALKLITLKQFGSRI